ncbi:MAG: hypothetical protein JXR40_05935 [Pontiellaceae bacterium]|nr:hypothetical protein [Pontiellaceae bacterium]
MTNIPHIHFVGIGGVGMNGLAQLAAQRGFFVSGSDRAYDPSAPLFNYMEQLGISLFPQDGSGVNAQTSHLVYSTAIESDNPDLAAAEKLDIPLLHRAEFLNQLIDPDAELIAVAGTAGKTTTTGMLGWIFDALGLNPTVYNGASVLNWKQNGAPGNIRSGSRKRWIIEADESDKSFLNFHPTHSIITNISKDHFELEELHAMFDRFRNQTSGIIIEGSPLSTGAPGTPNRFTFNGIEFTIPQIGQYNAENAHCAVRLCAALGMNLVQVRDALAQFKGIERRLEHIGMVDDITFIDDYAHNPAKIAAVLSAVAQTTSRVHAFWRPHGFTPLANGLNEFAETFSNHYRTCGGPIFILPVYYAGGTVKRTVSSEDLIEKLNSAGVPAQFVPDYATLKQELENCAEPGDTILGMGARDPELPQFARKLVAEWKRSNESKACRTHALKTR